jgi:hypothetical protein
MTFWHGLTPSFFLVCETLKAGDMCRCMAVLVNTCGQGWPNFILCTPLSHFVTDATWPNLATSGHIWPRLATSGHVWPQVCFQIPLTTTETTGSACPLRTGTNEEVESRWNLHGWFKILKLPTLWVLGPAT